MTQACSVPATFSFVSLNCKNEQKYYDNSNSLPSVPSGKLSLALTTRVTAAECSQWCWSLLFNALEMARQPSKCKQLFLVRKMQNICIGMYIPQLTYISFMCTLNLVYT